MKHSFFRSPLFFICLVIICSSAVYSDGKLETKTFFDNRLEIKIPAGFTVSTDEAMVKQNPAHIKSRLICAGPYTVPAFFITQYKDTLSQHSIAGKLESLVAETKKSDPSLEWISKGVKVINGRKVGYMQYIQYGDNYILEFFTDVDDNFVMFRFLCLTEQKKWISASNEMLESLKVK